MARIQRGSNIFAGMRMILPEHAEMMTASGESPRPGPAGRRTSEGGVPQDSGSAFSCEDSGRTSFLEEAEFLEFVEFLELAQEFHYEVEVAFRAGSRVRTVCGRVECPAVPGQVSISGRFGVVRIPWDSVIRVSRADGGEMDGVETETD